MLGRAGPGWGPALGKVGDQRRTPGLGPGPDGPGGPGIQAAMMVTSGNDRGVTAGPTPRATCWPLVGKGYRPRTDRGRLALVAGGRRGAGVRGRAGWGRAGPWFAALKGSR